MEKMSNNCAEVLKAIDAYKPKGQHEQIIARPVAKAIRYFCERDVEFAQAVEQKGGDFGGCLKAVLNGVGGALSDIEAYRRAVSYYFPGAGVRFLMEIDLTASVNGRKDILPGGDQLGGDEDSGETSGFQSAEKSVPASPARDKLSIDLDDLFD